ncbi:conserved hypothetical protein [Photobacterium leiognathi lrivu.4.1]|uniref:Integral membrane bound transporter domain-containing protein n=1 Tax=Photobacterium leiognathi lrivu.4.1 TaxID=1248232 RepID=A0A0U1P5N3_PHOLE|nr:FUSC family protein [Photobacterium leiognathi]GAD30006.1 conserved hypothetical protein [Photobacterium leiognathi lrivu.4.1]
MKNYSHFAIKYFRQLLVFRVFVALSIIISVIQIFNLPYGSWALITAVTIMGSIPFLGGVLSKASQRISGTILGAIIGLSLFLLPASYNWLHHVILIAAVVTAIFFTQGKYSYASLVVAITIVVVAGGGPEDLHAAVWRTINVFWAAVVAICCSLFIFPARATDHYLDYTHNFIKLCCDYYHKHNQQIATGNYKPIDISPLSTILDKQTALQPHTKNENVASKQLLTEIILTEEQIFTMLGSMLHTKWDTQLGQAKISDMPGLMEAKEQLANRFEKLAKQMEKQVILPVKRDEIKMLSILPPPEMHEQSDASDISYYGYLWLNREVARQFSLLTHLLHEYYSHVRY